MSTLIEEVTITMKIEMYMLFNEFFHMYVY